MPFMSERRSHPPLPGTGLPRGSLVLVALSLGVFFAVASDQAATLPPPNPPESTKDVQDIVFLGETRPVFLRLHIRVDGEPFQAVWEDYLQSLFEYLDRDGDGILTKEEGERAPPAVQVLQELQGRGAFFENRGGNFQEIDTDPAEGVVTPEKLAAYYRRAGAGPLVVATGSDPGYSADALTEALFYHLDVDKDGKLSRQELLAAPALLPRLDQDDDELISPRELIASVPGNRPLPQGGAAIGAPPPDLILVIPGQAPARLGQRLLEKYRKGGQTGLTRRDIRLEPETFDRLDADRDGRLDAEELARFLERSPDLELSLQLGKTGGPGGGLFHPNSPAGPLVAAAQPTGNTSVLITVGGCQIDLRIRDGQPLDFQLQRVRDFYLQQFDAADVGQKGFVELAAVSNRDFGPVRQVFSLADRDGDGKLTRKELVAFLDIRARAARSSALLTVKNRGRGLFEVIDANRDGHLGLRELRNAWSRLAPWAHDDRIAKTDIPLQYQISLSWPGRAVATEGLIAVKGVPAATAPKGPLWFRKMDRNGDGDVSPREFLGTREDFRRIDTDGDGLIDAAEAERAARWFPKR